VLGVGAEGRLAAEAGVTDRPHIVRRKSRNGKEVIVVGGGVGAINYCPPGGRAGGRGSGAAERLKGNLCRRLRGHKGSHKASNECNEKRASQPFECRGEHCTRFPL
jgi:hypothetical protein